MPRMTWNAAGYAKLCRAILATAPAGGINAADIAAKMREYGEAHCTTAAIHHQLGNLRQGGGPTATGDGARKRGKRAAAEEEDEEEEDEGNFPRRAPKRIRFYFGNGGRGPSGQTTVTGEEEAGPSGQPIVTGDEEDQDGGEEGGEAPEGEEENQDHA